MQWIRTGHRVHTDGSSEIRYEAEGTSCVIKSRKRAIPHANRSGYWWHTTYFLLRPDGSEKEYWTLRKAKEAAENEK